MNLTEEVETSGINFANGCDLFARIRSHVIPL